MIAEMLNIIDRLTEASERYYGGKDETMTDKQYDILSDRLAELEKKSGVVLPNSPSINVGADLGETGRKMVHEYPSLSLSKTKDPDELEEWLGNRVGYLSYKCDGLTVILTYENGRLISAETRGDGHIGENVTANAFHFTNAARRIPDKRHIVIRGEAVVKYSTFDAINDSLPADKQYKTPRSMAAGATRIFDEAKSAEFNVHFIPFDLVNASELGIDLYSEGMGFIRSIGMEPVHGEVTFRDNLKGLIERMSLEAKKLDYPTDGLVLTYDDVHLYSNLGCTAKFPRYAKAFKWQDELSTTVLRAIDWSVAKSGLISPVAIFDPVTIDGTTVKRASLHNISVAKKMKLGIGDHIRVYKANMIVPKVYDCIEQSDNIELPKNCPVCNSEISVSIGANGESIFCNCLNEDCPARN